MSAWPSTLPAPDNAGYAIEPLDPVLRSQMEVGADRTRRRTRARNDRITLSWSMTDAQLAIFRAWLDDDATGAAGGAAWFTIDLAIGGATLTETVEAKFVGVAKPARDRRCWRVTATLEVR